MASNDPRSARKTAVMWGIFVGIAALVCVIIFVCRPTGNRQSTGGDTAGGEMPPPLRQETPAPPALDALELVNVVYIPDRLRLVFVGLSVPRYAKQPSDTMVMFNKVDSGLIASYSLPVGAEVPGTKFRVDSFDHKEMVETDGKTMDLSEVTLISKETGERVVLPLNARPEDPYAIFRYKWVQPGGQPTPDFTIRLDHTFTLPPKRDTTYKVIAISNREVMIEVPDGTRKTLAVPK